MKVLRKLAGLGLGLVAFLAGCWGGSTLITPAYGMPPTPVIPHDPSVTLDDFSYSPPSPASPGDTLEFIATTNKPTDAGRIIVRIGDPEVNWMEFVYLNDEGYTPDEVANDGIWTGDIELASDEAPIENLPVTALFQWLDRAEGQELAGDDLTILEDSE